MYRRLPVIVRTGTDFRTVEYKSLDLRGVSTREGALRPKSVCVLPVVTIRCSQFPCLHLVDQDLPRSRVSMLEDTNNDGRMDKVTRFVDNMVLPRMILPFDDRIIINETYNQDYYSYRDTNGDGVTDEKILLYGGGKAG